MHLWSTAPQQVDKSGVEGHDGVPHVNEVIIIVLDKISVTRNNHNNKKIKYYVIFWAELKDYLYLNKNRLLHRQTETLLNRLTPIAIQCFLHVGNFPVSVFKQTMENKLINAVHRKCRIYIKSFFTWQTWQV